MANMTALGLNKVFILDKYFTELNKYWQNECLHQGKSFVFININFF